MYHHIHDTLSNKYDSDDCVMICYAYNSRKRIGGGGRDKTERSLVSIAQTVTSTSSSSSSNNNSNSSNNNSAANAAPLPVNMSANFSQHQRGTIIDSHHLSTFVVECDMMM
jgi:hypothetical protein